ncbi:MAG TPA: opioid growth factor receptor-related protein [Bryobacteraceae bacterium]
MTRTAQNPDRRILDFYAGEKTDDRGRYLRDLWNWPDERLEDVHDYIQWMFPLRDPSAFNSRAPLLDAETIAAFRTSPELQQNLRTSFLRMLRFYGLETDGGRVAATPNFAARSSDWLWANNHNHLRITRILVSLRLLGLEPEAQAFYAFLATLYEREKGQAQPAITAASFRFWTAAARDPLPRDR